MSNQQDDKKSWVILTTRYGEDIANPSQQNVVNALEELYQESRSKLTEQDFEEHPNTWLRYGFNEGLMYVLDFYRTGLVLFSKYAGTDFNERIKEQQMESVRYEMALTLSLWLLEGKLNTLAVQPWKNGT